MNFFFLFKKKDSILEQRIQKAVAYYMKIKICRKFKIGLILYEQIKKTDNTNIRYGLTI